MFPGVKDARRFGETGGYDDVDALRWLSLASSAKARALPDSSMNTVSDCRKAPHEYVEGKAQAHQQKILESLNGGDGQRLHSS